MHQFLRGTRRIHTGPGLNGFLPPPARGTSGGLCGVRLRPVGGMRARSNNFTCTVHNRGIENCRL